MSSEGNIQHAMKPKNGKLIFRAHEFDPKTDMIFNFLTKDTVNKQKSSQQYTIFVSNSYIGKNSEVSDKNVYFAVGNIQLTRQPIYPYNDKTAQYYPKGKKDARRAFITISINEKDKNCLGLKELFEGLDNHFQSEEFKLKFFEAFGYNEKTKDNYVFEYYPIYKPPEENEDDENKKAYSEFGSVKIKFDVQTKDYSDPANPKDLEDPIFKTTIFKIDESTKRPKKCSISSLEDIENIIRRNAIVNFVIRFQKCYCSKPQKAAGNKKKFTYGFSPIFEQITIHHSGDASSSGNREYIDIGDGELDEGEIDSNKEKESMSIKPEIPKKSVNKKQTKNIKDEPEGEIDEEEHNSEDEVPISVGDSDEGGDEEDGENEEGEDNEEDGEDIADEETDEAEEEPPKKPVKKTITPKKK